MRTDETLQPWWSRALRTAVTRGLEPHSQALAGRNAGRGGASLGCSGVHVTAVKRTFSTAQYRLSCRGEGVEKKDEPPPAGSASRWDGTWRVSGTCVALCPPKLRGEPEAGR